MSTESAPLAPEMALRIGLAARALPDTDPARLLKVLDDAVGLPPTEASLSKLSVKALRSAAGGDMFGLPQDALKQAVAILKGQDETLDAVPLPETQAYADGDMPDSIRVAVASNTGAALDGHFGSCARFLIYQVNKDEVRLIDIRSTEAPDEADDKNAFRAGLITDCQVLYVVSIGGPAAAKVVRQDIHPIKKPQGGSAADMLAELKAVLGKAPPPWLAKVMGHDAESRVRFDLEGDEELEGAV